MGPLFQLLVLPKAGAILLLFSEISKRNGNNHYLLSDYTYFSPQTRVEQTPQVNFSPAQSSHRDL